jgi:hypothetical protein
MDLLRIFYFIILLFIFFCWFGFIGCMRDCKREFLFDNIDLPTMLAA